MNVDTVSTKKFSIFEDDQKYKIYAKEQMAKRVTESDKSIITRSRRCVRSMQYSHDSTRGAGMKRSK
jgi:hypothetical protein